MVRRETPAGAPVVIDVPLLPGEAITTARRARRQRQERSAANVSLGPDDRGDELALDADRIRGVRLRADPASATRLGRDLAARSRSDLARGDDRDPRRPPRRRRRARASRVAALARRRGVHRGQQAGGRRRADADHRPRGAGAVAERALDARHADARRSGRAAAPSTRSRWRRASSWKSVHARRAGRSRCAWRATGAASCCPSRPASRRFAISLARADAAVGALPRAQPSTSASPATNIEVADRSLRGPALDAVGGGPRLGTSGADLERGARAPAAGDGVLGRTGV